MSNSLILLSLLFIKLIFSEVHAAEISEEAQYCDVTYRVTKFGRVKNIEVVDCVPEKTKKKYSKWTKEIVSSFRFDPKTINGVKVESKNERARIIYDSQYRSGYMIKIYPSDDVLSEPAVIESTNEN